MICITEVAHGTRFDKVYMKSDLKCRVHLQVNLHHEIVALDSSPTIPIRIPSDVQFNVSPSYWGRKVKGQPLLGQQNTKYTHFVPMGDASAHIKKLLEIPESSNVPTQPLEGYQEVLKAEKASNLDVKSNTDPKVFDTEFKENAANFLASPNIERENIYQEGEKTSTITEKNDAGLVNIIAAAHPAPKPRTKPKPIIKPKVKPNLIHHVQSKKPRENLKNPSKIQPHLGL